jgi:carbonic anhydrase
MARNFMESRSIKELSGGKALDILLEGNKRFVENRRENPNQSNERRTSLTDGQSPFAIILGCSDSRVPPEIIFDRGLGDLFVIRVAGNVVNDIVLASIEYAAVHLHSPLLMVLGHTNCGAVTAAFDETVPEGHLARVTDIIKKSIEEVGDSNIDSLTRKIKAHILKTVNDLKSSEPVLRNLVKLEKLTVIPALYDMSTGIVEII